MDSCRPPLLRATPGACVQALLGVQRYSNAWRSGCLHAWDCVQPDTSRRQARSQPPSACRQGVSEWGTCPPRRGTKSSRIAGLVLNRGGRTAAGVLAPCAYGAAVQRPPMTAGRQAHRAGPLHRVTGQAAPSGGIQRTVPCSGKACEAARRREGPCGGGETHPHSPGRPPWRAAAACRMHVARAVGQVQFSKPGWGSSL